MPTSNRKILSAIAKEGIALAKQNGHNVVIIDTAGRLAIDEAMMVEIEQVKAAVNPHEILFVVDYDRPGCCEHCQGV
jgi:signal recognition particle GTPase